MSKLSCCLICLLCFALMMIILNLTFIGHESKEMKDQLNSKEAFTTKKKKKKKLQHQLGGLSCEAYGGPSDEAAAEMVYWKDIPSDRRFKNPFANVDLDKNPKYLTMEPDIGDWNNKRMALETAAVMALVLGRILVLPPANQQVIFQEIFPFENIASEYNLKVITMEEFLKREGMTGNLKDKNGNPQLPIKTDWDHDPRITWELPLWPYLKQVTTPVIWDKDDCVAAIPSQPGELGEQRVREYFAMATTGSKTGQIVADQQQQQDISNLRIESYTANPTAVDAPPQDRLREMLAKRNNLCVYDTEMHNTKFLHILGGEFGRLLTHFYALLFFEDWRQDLFVKRFVRDHFRYRDELQCAAARIVEELRQYAIQNGDPSGEFDTFHIRRGDFLNFRGSARVDAAEIFKRTRSVLKEGSVVYIATDERDKSFFQPLKDHYKLYFLDDFQALIPGISVSKFGQLDQLVASRGRTFVGLYFSTFTGYINRMRAYHAMKDKAPGYEEGVVPSYYYADREFKYHMRQYRSISWPIWAREYPVGWRDIDHDVLDVDVKL